MIALLPVSGTGLEPEGAARDHQHDLVAGTGHLLVDAPEQIGEQPAGRVHRLSRRSGRRVGRGPDAHR